MCFEGEGGFELGFIGVVGLSVVVWVVGRVVVVEFVAESLVVAAAGLGVMTFLGILFRFCVDGWGVGSAGMSSSSMILISSSSSTIFLCGGRDARR